ncbi:MAG: hypothetical protein R2867_05640 [Caldilineaceae bacterium]
MIMYAGFKYFNVQNIGGLFSPEYLSAEWSIARVWDMLKHLPLPRSFSGWLD